MDSNNFADRGDLKISGSGSAGGGNYNSIKISGSGSIKGNINCREMVISGSGKVDGNVEALNIKFSGSGKINGNVSSDEIKVSGSGNFKGKVEANSMSVSGATAIEEGVKAENLAISGSFRVNKKIEGGTLKLRGELSSESCEVENFDSEGSFRISSLLSADNILISLIGRCEAKEIGGEAISVRKGYSKRGILQNIFGAIFDPDGILIAEVIEGDEIYLENTKAKFVRGSRVTIGFGCDIDNVEYKESIQVDEKSNVKNRCQAGDK